MTSDRFRRRSSLLAGFLKEGLVMYACATGSLLSTIVTLSLTNPSQLDVRVTNDFPTQLIKFYFSRFTSQVYKGGESYIHSLLLDKINGVLRVVVGATIVSVCHALLNIRSLSATLHVDPAWLLNHAELSRVQWTKGDREGEIFVELQPSRESQLPMVNISRTGPNSDVMQPSDLGISTRSN
ncbi:hypothetical protein AZE42_02837 [Rhizopogon vesiculosus]|uniref:Uncharacterized protein n=1 Tax=Rhizopogon vesiculosus TaxID=180088 RepID=A0A1J8Q9Q4_9AGAM|nr:hypothetical protein AZE42_02837 [Rhizopogon vesiculosus]